MGSLTTAKPGSGVMQLRDGNINTWGQSDGSQPHLVNIQFHKKMELMELALYAEYKLDESYTPKKISIRAGTSFDDLVEVHTIHLDKPMGWIAIPLPPQNPRDKHLRAFLLQIAVLSSHQNGRDTHIR